LTESRRPAVATARLAPQALSIALGLLAAQYDTLPGDERITMRALDGSSPAGARCRRR
jgi:hypothetical protein